MFLWPGLQCGLPNALTVLRLAAVPFALSADDARAVGGQTLEDLDARHVLVQQGETVAQPGSLHLEGGADGRGVTAVLEVPAP